MTEQRVRTVQGRVISNKMEKMRHALGQAKLDERPSAAYLQDCVTRFIKGYS